MSNQVYANSTLKYKDLRGLSTFGLTAPQSVAAGSVNVVNWNQAQIISGDQNDIWAITSGVITLDQDSFVSLQSFCVIQSAVNPASDRIEVELFMDLTRPGAFSNQPLDYKQIDFTGSATIDKTINSVSYSGWLLRGDQIRVWFSPKSGTPSCNLLTGSTLLINGL